MDDASPNTEKSRRAHPLAIALIERLRDIPNARVLEIGTGNARNTTALRDAGIIVDTIADGGAIEIQMELYDAALSTHGLLHGDLAAVTATLDAIAASLKPQAPLYATFGSVDDARYGKGRKLAENVYAPVEGDEVGVPHLFFDEPRLRELLVRNFEIEELSQRDADAIVGRWAHREPLRGVVHWFVRATRRP